MQTFTTSQFSSFFPPLPPGFLTLYEGKSGVEIFDAMVSGLLKLLAKALMAWSVPALSSRCFHQWGGAKMLLREVNAWRKPGDFIYKTDVYSYYASLNPSILFEQLLSLCLPCPLLDVVIAYCQRTILSPGKILLISRKRHLL